MVKVGICGLGFMGLTHLRAFQQHPRVKLVAVADEAKARRQGHLYEVQGNIKGKDVKFDFSGLNTHESVDGILDDPEVELLSVCLPTPFHAGVVKKGLARGKHVLCEKPMGLTAKEVDDMVEVARSSDQTLMVAQCVRFWPEYKKARQIALSGEIGNVLSARFERLSSMPTWSGWLADEAASGGMILDLSIHDIDFALHLLGVPEKVRAEGACDVPKGFDHYRGTLYCSGVPISIEGGWIFPGQYPFSMGFEILCEGGILSYHSDRRPLTVYRGDGSHEELPVDPGDGYSGEIGYLIGCLEEGKEPELSPPEESAMSVKVALLLKESRKRGGTEMEVARTVAAD